MTIETDINPQTQNSQGVSANVEDVESKKVSREEAARKGGQAVSRDRAHMAEIGRKGGQAVSRNREHMARIGRKGGESVSKDRAHMAQIGQKGGERRGMARKTPNYAAPIIQSEQNASDKSSEVSHNQNAKTSENNSHIKAS